MWIGPQDIWEQGSQRLIGLKLGSDLPQERLRNRPRVRKNPNRDLGVVQDIQNGEAEGNDRTLEMFASPKVEIAIRRRLHLATPLEYPIAIDIRPRQHVAQQKVQIGLR